MTPGRTYHYAISVDIDRFSDRKIEDDWLPMFLKLGCRTAADVRAQCAEARARGQAVFAPCEHTKDDGSCAGHPITEPG